MTNWLFRIAVSSGFFLGFQELDRFLGRGLGRILVAELRLNLRLLVIT